MYYVYVLCNSSSKEMYVGFTSDLKARIRSHNLGLNRSTKRKEGFWNLIYYEAFKSESDARKREKRLKQHGRARQELFKRLAESTKEC